MLVSFWTDVLELKRHYIISDAKGVAVETAQYLSSHVDDFTPRIRRWLCCSTTLMRRAVAEHRVRHPTLVTAHLY